MARHRHNPNCGDGVFLAHFDLPGIGRGALHAFLNVVPNLECLILDLHTPESAPKFPAVVIPLLETFQTNLPHSKIKSFLETNLATHTLSLTRPCEAGCCLSGANLPHIWTMEVPASCVGALMHIQVSRLTIWATNRRVSRDISLILRGLPASNVEYLTVDHAPSDFGIISWRWILFIHIIFALAVNHGHGNVYGSSAIIHVIQYKSSALCYDRSVFHIR